MFGHDDKKKDNDDEQVAAVPEEQVIEPAADTQSDAPSEDWQPAGAPPTDDAGSTDEPATEDNPEPVAEPVHDEPAEAPEPTPEPASRVDIVNDPIPSGSYANSHAGALHGSGHASSDFNNDGEDDQASDDLIDIKQEALGKLTPLIGHLDQSPEEKFRTLMMMIQASDDQGLVREAYNTAQHIQDEKTKAQALLDIVNEINYFTQNPQSE